MRINNIQSSGYKHKDYSNFNKNSNNKADMLAHKNITDLNKFYSTALPAFTGTATTLQNFRDYSSLNSIFTPECKEIIENAKKIAKKANSSEVQSWHIYYANLLKLKKYINELDNGTIKYDEETRYKTPHVIEGAFGSSSEEIFKNKDNRAKIKKVINKHLKQTQDIFLKSSKKAPQKTHLFGIPLSADAIDNLVETYRIISKESSVFFDSYIYTSALNSKDRRLSKEAMEFDYDIQKALMIETSKKDKNHLSFYDDKANLIWKNIGTGKNVAVLCDTKSYSQLQHLKSSFSNLINKPGQEYKNINPDKTDVIVLNNLATLDFLENLVNECKRDKERNKIIVLDLRVIFKNNGTSFTEEQLKLLSGVSNSPNIKFVLTMDTGTYFVNMQKDAPLQKGLSNFSCQTLPTLNAKDTIKYLTNEDGIKYVKNIVQKNIDTEAIKKAIELTAYEDGDFPDKAINLLKSASLFDLEVEEITPEILVNYMQKTKNLSETIADSSDDSIIFNTGKNLSDIVGTPMTKADAQNVVSQIKNGTFKTKGYTIFRSDNSSYGGGRKHTAFAIAGETGIPVIKVNAKDFALKDIDTLSQNADFSEMKIKKLISTAKAQAETNEYNTAMIFIENFDNFGSNSLCGISSIYEQKAFSQLLDEMENTKKNDACNLLIIGSVNMPETLDENIMKPNRFLNSIIVYSPANVDETKEVFKYYIDKMDLKIAGSTKEQQEKTINEISQTAKGFSVVDIMYILETAKDIMAQRNKDSMDISDLTEAYLQATTGRSAGTDLNEHGKNIVTSHEAGHALALQIMNEVRLKHGKNWQLPNKINFITLDPRGYYGGAMYHKPSENKETSFEKIMSDLVCSYGGHSAEKIIYGMDGSWGISADMEHVSALAKAAVLDMGMGPKTGVCHIEKNVLGQIEASESKKLKIEQDIDTFLLSAKYISDRIIEEYKPFILEFTKNHAKDVGSGNCLIPSEQFIKELNNWRDRQDEKTKQRLNNLEKEILDTELKAKSNK